jgi:hypothetical protein
MRQQGDPYRPNAVISDAWLLQQQMRAEVEAQEWRRLREQLAQPPAPYYPEDLAPARPLHKGGSIILKGLVRFALGAFGGYLGFIAAIDGGAGEFEAWLAVAAGFIIALSLSAFGYGRDFVVWVAEAMRWVIISGLALGVLWMIARLSA